LTGGRRTPLYPLERSGSRVTRRTFDRTADTGQTLRYLPMAGARPMRTIDPCQLPSASELVQLLQTAFPMHPMHWQNHVRSLGLSLGRDLPPEELARVTERVFWTVRQMGIKDPVTWLANRRRLDAAKGSACRVKAGTVSAIAGCSTVQREFRQLEGPQRGLDAAKTSDVSLAILENGTTRVETEAGDSGRRPARMSSIGATPWRWK
jgi:hypothetical protein